MAIAPALQEVLDLLDLEKLEVNMYRGLSQDMGGGAVFGGQVLGQALVAASRTVEKQGLDAHSLHGYFLRPGDMKAPIVYDVDRIRDGRSFTTRRVRAIQHGEAIFNMSVSFQVQEPGLEHQMPAPEFQGPDGLKDEVELRMERQDDIPEAIRQRSLRDRPFDMRPVDQVDYMIPKKGPPYRQTWLRACGELGDDTVIHQALIAYASDMGLMSTCLLPHGINYMTRGFQGASLDHAMWFHAPFRADDWLLYESDAPITRAARGFNRGGMYTRDGQLVVSTAQEALVRLWDKPRSRKSTGKPEAGEAAKQG